MVAVDLEEIYVQKIVVEIGLDPKKCILRTRCQGNEPEYDTGLVWSAVKDSIASVEYSKEDPEYNLGHNNLISD